MDTQSTIFLIFINVLTGWLADEVIKELVTINILGLRILPFSIISVLIVSLLIHIDIEFLFLLNVFFSTALSLPLLFLLMLYHMENFLIEYGTTTFTAFLANNFKSTFVKKCREGSLGETQIFIVAHNMIGRYFNIGLLCDHCFGTAIAESATNNHIEVLDLLLKNFNLGDNLDLAKKLITHVSRLGHYDIFKLLIEKTNMKIVDAEFYETHNIQIGMVDALRYVKEDYNKAVSILGITSINEECTENCMICHDPHDNILKLECGHFVCLESMCSYYQQNLSEEMKCFICRHKINIKKIISYSK